MGSCGGKESAAGGPTAAPLAATASSVALQASTAAPQAGHDPAALIDRSRLVVRRLGNITDAYVLDDGKIGQGTFGSVRKCRQKATNAVYAVKAIPKGNVGNMGQFWQEVANMKRMDHPNIVRLYETFEDNKRIYLVMELCRGGELFHRIVKAGHFTEREAAIVMQQILRAVLYMHSHDISHRDLKPENFLFMTEDPIENNVLKVIDFGLSCHVKPGAVLTAMAGTASYVAPQVLARKYDKQCDLWSCGVVMYVLLCGQSPFRGKNEKEVLDKVREGRLTFQGKAWKQVSQDAKLLIQQLVKVDPKERYTSEQALAHVWIQEKAPRASAQLHSGLVEALRHFRSENRLKKAALHVITKQLSDTQTRCLRTTFTALDKNSDGTLTLDELREGLRKSGLVDRAKDIEEIVLGLDVDGSGSVDYTEFMAAALDRGCYLQERLCRAAFGVFDLDGDGRITRSELQKVLDGGSKERFADAAREELLRDIDGDGDGAIDFQEFMAMMRRPSGGGPSSKARLGSA
mmetsp:Transcript_66719/g.150658  ORF Transcript_66719/g.150658 Transcript_66719/m.150658 type:complete len:518 (-) Transcript_66719:45-1598(-)